MNFFIKSRVHTILMLTALTMLAHSNLRSQAPEKMSYQAVIWSSNNNLVINQQVGIRLSVLQGSSTGTVVYMETHSANTNSNGLVSIEVGSGVSGLGSFTNIDWSNGPYFLKTETDPNGGSNYTISGVTQFLSVPYSLYSKSASNGLPSGGTEGQVLSICNGVPCWIDCGTCPAVVLTLDCNSAIITGQAIENTPLSNVLIEITYSGGNAGNLFGQSIQSVGVNGLVATVDPGSINNGSGTISLSVTGTPLSAGTASFDISIGGQTCIVDLTVQAASNTAYPPNYVHCNLINPTQVIDVINPVTGATWMDRNLGSNRAALSSTDAESHGSLFQWGRPADGHQCVHRYSGDGIITSSTSSILSTTDTPNHGDFITVNSNPTTLDWRIPQNDNLWQGASGTNNPCPTGYRVPTEAEWEAERQSWTDPLINGTNDANGAFISPLKLPTPGYRNHISGNLLNGGPHAVYWSSTVNGIFARRMGYNFSPGNASMFFGNRAMGMSVRCIKD